jgi:hypothetical protein
MNKIYNLIMTTCFQIHVNIIGLPVDMITHHWEPNTKKSKYQSLNNKNYARY